MTDNCLSSVSRTKTRYKIATRCSTSCSKKDALEGVETQLILLNTLVVYYIKGHTTCKLGHVQTKNSKNDMVLLILTFIHTYIPK